MSPNDEHEFAALSDSDDNFDLVFDINPDELQLMDEDEGIHSGDVSMRRDHN